MTILRLRQFELSRNINCHIKCHSAKVIKIKGLSGNCDSVTVVLHDFCKNGILK